MDQVKRNMRGFSLRKKRLFACACCRNIWNIDDPLYDMINIPEQFSDDLISGKILRNAHKKIHKTAIKNKGTDRLPLFFTLSRASDPNEGYMTSTHLKAKEYNPLFDFVTLSSYHFTKTYSQTNFSEKVIRLGNVIYKEKLFNDLFVLHDMLIDYECEDLMLLKHLRGPWGEIKPSRGWAALDWILNKRDY